MFPATLFQKNKENAKKNLLIYFILTLNNLCSFTKRFVCDQSIAISLFVNSIRNLSTIG